MTGTNPTGGDGALAQGVAATHISPETGDTARATMGEGSSAGTQGAQPSPPDGAHMRPSDRPEQAGAEPRTFEGGSEGIPGTPSQAGAALESSEEVQDVSDGKDGRTPRHDSAHDRSQ